MKPKKGDILLYTDGDMLRVIDFPDWGAAVSVLSVYSEEETYLSRIDYSYTNLGQSLEVLAAFYSARSIHVRLNRMNKV